MSLRVLLADDHRMMREGLRLILERVPDLEVVGEAQNGWMAIEMVERLLPDLVVMDIAMRDLNGVEATRQIRTAHPNIKVVALSMHADNRYVLGMLEAGASGYVLKAAAGEELIRAVEAVSQGRYYLSSEITGIVLENYVRRLFPTDISAYSALSERERQVLQLLAEGRSSKETAACLSISTATAETHRRNIMRKLDLHSIADLTKYAIREGLTDLEA